MGVVGIERGKVLYDVLFSQGGWRGLIRTSFPEVGSTMETSSRYDSSSLTLRVKVHARSGGIYEEEVDEGFPKEKQLFARKVRIQRGVDTSLVAARVLTVHRRVSRTCSGLG